MSQDNKTNVRIASKMDTKANLTEYNPVLLDKEVVYERDTGRYKIGDGVSRWNELSYFGGKANENIINVKVPNTMFFEIPNVNAEKNEEVLAYTIENWNEMVDENNVPLYDFFISFNYHVPNGFDEGSTLKKLQLDNFITYWSYSNGPDTWYQDIKITNDGKVYIQQRGWSDSRSTEATNILAIRKTQNTIVTTNTENYATKDDIINLINSISESEY